MNLEMKFMNTKLSRENFVNEKEKSIQRRTFPLKSFKSTQIQAKKSIQKFLIKNILSQRTTSFLPFNLFKFKDNWFLRGKNTNKSRCCNIWICDIQKWNFFIKLDSSPNHLFHFQSLNNFLSKKIYVISLKVELLFLYFVLLSYLCFSWIFPCLLSIINNKSNGKSI